MRRLRIIASASVLALVLGSPCLATVSLADGDEGDGISVPQGEAQAPSPNENAGASPQQAPPKDLDPLRAHMAAQNLELGETGARLSVAQAALRDQTLRGDVLTCVAVVLLGAVAALSWRVRLQGASAAKPDPAEKAKGPRRPSSLEPHDPPLP